MRFYETESLRFYEAESELGHDLSIELETLTEYKIVFDALITHYYNKLEEYEAKPEEIEPSRVEEVQARWLEMVELNEEAPIGSVVPDRSFQLTPKEVEVAARQLLEAEGSIDGRTRKSVGLEMYETLSEGHMKTTVLLYGNGNGSAAGSASTHL